MSELHTWISCTMLGAAAHDQSSQCECAPTRGTSASNTTYQSVRQPEHGSWQFDLSYTDLLLPVTNSPRCFVRAAQSTARHGREIFLVAMSAARKLRKVAAIGLDQVRLTKRCMPPTSSLQRGFCSLSSRAAATAQVVLYPTQSMDMVFSVLCLNNGRCRERDAVGRRALFTNFQQRALLVVHSHSSTVRLLLYNIQYYTLLA